MSGTTRNPRPSGRGGSQLIRVGDGPLRSVTLPTIGRVRVHDDTRRLRQLLRPRAQIDPATGEEQVAPRAKILFATIARRGTRWYVSLNVHATDLHPGRGHQPCPEREAGGYVGVDVGLVASRSRQDPTEPRSGAGRPTIPCPAGFAGSSAVPAPCRERSAAPGTTERPPGGFDVSTPGLPTPAAASSMRSRATWSRTTPCWPSRTLPSTILSATTALPAPSGTPLGPSSPVSSPTRPSGWGWISWCATVGSRQVGPALGAAPSRCE